MYVCMYVYQVVQNEVVVQFGTIWQLISQKLLDRFLEIWHTTWKLGPIDCIKISKRTLNK